MLQCVVQKLEWDAIVSEFSNVDVYYIYGYAQPFKVHGDGEPMLFFYRNNQAKAINVVMKRKITLNNNETDYFDIITPYGYGGWHFEGDYNDSDIQNLDMEFTDYCKNNKIVSEFVRFHPLLNNAHIVDSVYNVIDLGKTIAMDLADETVIWQNIISKNRNMIRKAIKSDITIKTAQDSSIFAAFADIYNKTMDRDNADLYYYFGEEFYAAIRSQLNNNAIMYYAELNGEIIGAAIIMWGNKFVHYHLSGAKKEYMNLAPMNLLLYQVACDFSKKGYKLLHLGGGVGSNSESGLFKFKESFNKNGQYQFSIGKKVFMQEEYNKLVAERAKENDFDTTSQFFPLYRS